MHNGKLRCKYELSSLVIDNSYAYKKVSNKEHEKSYSKSKNSLIKN